MKKIMKIKWFVLMLFVLCLSFSVSADMGPKPTADFFVTYQNNAIPGTLFADMMVCEYKKIDLNERMQNRGENSKNIMILKNISRYDEERNCYWQGSSMANFGMGAECDAGKCHFNYFLPPKFVLAIYIPDMEKIYFSDEIQRTKFNSEFKININSENDIDIEDVSPVFTEKIKIQFLVALIITLIIEIIVALIFIFITKISKKMLIYVGIVNIISLPLVWFLFPLLSIPPLFIIIIAEVFVILFESIFIYLSKLLSFKKSFLLSLIMNLASIFIGGFIYLSLMMLFGI